MDMKANRRTLENRGELMDIVQMRIDGYTFQEIADKYGVTKQCIQQKLSVISGSAKPRPKRIDEKVIYPNLAKWMFEYKIPKCRLTKIIGISPTNIAGISRRLYEEQDFTITEIKALIEITGETFEHLFAKKEKK